MVYRRRTSMTLEDIKDKPIVGLAEGEKIGVAHDFLIDPKQLRATALVLGGQPGQGLLPLTSIRSIGADAITIESATLIQWTTSQLKDENGRTGTDLLSLTVVDESGTVLGTGRSLALSDTGELQNIEVHKGGVFGIGEHRLDISPAQIRNIGPKLITVAEEKSD